MYLRPLFSAADGLKRSTQRALYLKEAL